MKLLASKNKTYDGHRHVAYIVPSNLYWYELKLLLRQKIYKYINKGRN